MIIGASYKFSNLDIQYIPADNRKELAEKYLAESLANEILKNINIHVYANNEGIEYRCTLEIIENKDTDVVLGGNDGIYIQG